MKRGLILLVLLALSGCQNSSKDERKAPAPKEPEKIVPELVHEIKAEQFLMLITNLSQAVSKFEKEERAPFLERMDEGFELLCQENKCYFQKKDKK